MNINEYEINNLTDKEEVGQVRSIDLYFLLQTYIQKLFGTIISVSQLFQDEDDSIKKWLDEALKMVNERKY
jgi:hypothetical protein